MNNNYCELPTRDENRALLVSGGSQQVADRLFAEFCLDLPVCLDQLKSAYTAYEWKSLWDVAHRLHGATAVCALPALNNALRTLQKSSQQRDHVKTSAALAEVQRQATRLTRETLLSTKA